MLFILSFLCFFLFNLVVMHEKKGGCYCNSNSKYCDRKKEILIYYICVVERKHGKMWTQ